MRHPSCAGSFEWDEHNEAELAGHNVMPWEVEDLFFEGRPTFHCNKRSAAATWRMSGCHPTSGRPLHIFILWADEDEAVLRVVTGWQPRSGRS